MRKNIVLNLELDASGEALTGDATDGSGGARSFSGWLGLLAAIDALVQQRTDASPLDEPREAAGSPRSTGTQNA